MNPKAKRSDPSAAKEDRRAMTMIWPFVGVILLVIAGTGGWMIWGGPAETISNMPVVDTRMHGAGAGAAPTPAAQIILPQLTAKAEMGRQFFEEKCVSCHGKNAAGTDQGPPFVHRIYEPSHHADFAWTRAVRGGVQAHHWRYGNMPPVEGLDDKQIAWIVEYVRELQRANGIQ